MSVALDAVLMRLKGVRRTGGGWVALCPAHADKNPSLSISESGKKILLHCHAGCSIYAVCSAAGIELQELSADRPAVPPIADLYSYSDENGVELYQVVRFKPKGFRQRRPNGMGAWIWNLKGVRRVLYRLPEVLNAATVLVCEGEKDCETARKLGFVATCNPGGAGNWREEYSESLRGKDVAIIADADGPGRKHAAQVAASLAGKAKTLKVLELPGAKDLSEWNERGGTSDALRKLIERAPEWNPQTNAFPDKRKPLNPWSLAAGMDVFLRDVGEVVKFLYPPIIAKEAVTEIFAPRGLGKSLWALFVAVWLALAGYKVLLIDRDNPRRVIRDRLRSFGATGSLTTLKVLSRENAPPLTNARAWAEFPYMEYDVVIVDSIDSAAEGVGEQDSTKPSRAIAPLLDIVRRENGPAALLLGNTIKSATHSRGSGIVEDRADIVFEVRDATNFHPAGKKSWIEELPAADAASWVGRSTRRKRQSQYRLAFIATKFRIGEEPEPFIVEIDLATDPWTVRDVTDLVDGEGAEARRRIAKERESEVAAAVELLKTEVLRREVCGEPEILKKQAEEFLTSRGVKQKIARDATSSPAFEVVDIGGKGNPKGLRLAGKNDNANRNAPPTETAVYASSSSGDFGHPHPERVTEIAPPNTQCLSGSQRGGISVEESLSTPHGSSTTKSQQVQTPPLSSGPRGTEEEL